MLNTDDVAEKRQDLIDFRKKVWRVTQQEAADFLGISWGQYRNYEYRPDQPIPAEVLAKITALGYLSLTGSRLMPVTAQAYGTLKVYGAVSAGASVEPHL